MIRFLHGFEQNSGGTRSLPGKKWGDEVPPRPRPTTPLLSSIIKANIHRHIAFVIPLFENQEQYKYTMIINY